MKKTIAAMVIGVMAAVSAFGATTFAEENSGKRVVDNVEYTDGDGIISSTTVIWYDAAGNEYRQTIKAREEKPVSGMTSKVSWTDEAGNLYVSDEASHTVTIYDCNGNLIAVHPQ